MSHHARARIAERYGVRLDAEELEALYQRLGAGEGLVKRNHGHGIEDRYITVAGCTCLLVRYDARNDVILTAIPARQRRDYYASWRPGNRKRAGASGGARREGRRPDSGALVEV